MPRIAQARHLHPLPADTCATCHQSIADTDVIATTSDHAWHLQPGPGSCYARRER